MASEQPRDDIDHITDSMDRDIGDEVTVNKFGTTRSGVVENKRKTYTVYQYLVNYDDGGRAWINEKHVN